MFCSCEVAERTSLQPSAGFSSWRVARTRRTQQGHAANFCVPRAHQPLCSSQVPAPEALLCYLPLP
jgi:hypothetical protein